MFSPSDVPSGWCLADTIKPSSLQGKPKLSMPMQIAILLSYYQEEMGWAGEMEQWLPPGISSLGTAFIDLFIFLSPLQVQQSEASDGATGAFLGKRYWLSSRLCVLSLATAATVSRENPVEKKKKKEYQTARIF